jgi:hypothetical protein
MALSATVGQTIAGVMRPGILLSLTGIGAGVGMSLFGVRFSGVCWGVRETDPVTFVKTAGFAGGGSAASLTPALRILSAGSGGDLWNEQVARP